MSRYRRSVCQGRDNAPPSDAEAIRASLQSAEAERGMARVAAPHPVILDGQFLNVNGQSEKQLPNPAGGNGVHVRGGHWRRGPCADSVSASSNRKSSFPAAESRSICSSQRASSRARNHWTMRRYSSGGKLLIAASISSTRSMLGVYHRQPAPLPRRVRPQESRRRARGDGARTVLGQQPDIALAERLAADGAPAFHHDP